MLSRYSDHSERPLKRWHGIVLGAVFVVFISLRWIVPAIVPPPRPAPVSSREATVTVASTSFRAVIVDTPELTYRGLSGYPSLGPYGGMLFVFSTTATRTFVMRDMQFPLDMVWFTDGVITDIHEHVPLEPGISEPFLTLYSGKKPVNMVLEVASGTVARYGWAVGDSLRVQY